VAECMAKLLRVHAPDTPFTDEQVCVRVLSTPPAPAAIATLLLGTLKRMHTSAWPGMAPDPPDGTRWHQGTRVRVQADRGLRPDREP
jgi:hypothetical protein